MMRCTNVCTVAAVLSEANPTYTVVAADAGAVLRVAETAANATGHTSVWSFWFVGPVGSTAVAAGTIAGGSQAALRNDHGRALAYAQVGAGAGPAAASDLTPMLASRLPLLVLRVRPAKGSRAAWSPGHAGCSAATAARRALRSPTRSRSPAPTGR